MRMASSSPSVSGRFTRRTQSSGRLIQAVRDQLGLELVKATRPLEFLVVNESVGDGGG